MELVAGSVCRPIRCTSSDSHHRWGHCAGEPVGIDRWEDRRGWKRSRRGCRNPRFEFPVWAFRVSRLTAAGVARAWANAEAETETWITSLFRAARQTPRSLRTCGNHTIGIREVSTAESAVTYEITATVQAELCDAYERYMRGHHIPDLMSTGAFTGASFSRSGPGRYRIRYEAPSQAALDQYLANHAPRLREHFVTTFPSGVELTREEWTVLERWTPSSRR